MYTGWRRDLKYPINRPLMMDEKRDVLSRDAAVDQSFDERGGLVDFNSTYIEWVDRRFRARGAATTAGSLIVSLGCVGAAIFCTYFGFHHRVNHDLLLIVFVGFLSSLFFAWLFYWRGWGIDFFQKVYYPIRFNRKNRMIYVYRDKRDGGNLQVSWDKVYFHVGRGMMNPDFCDIRGEVLDGEIVKDTFALGPYYPEGHVEAVEQAWAFICRYMEKGPEAVGPDPRDRYVQNSLNGTWMDCAGVMYTNYTPTNPLTLIIGVPMIAVTTLTRWLVFKSCRMPRWPDDIEAACKVEPHDPHRWPQPKYGNQFLMEMPAVKARLAERRNAIRRRAREALPQSELSRVMADWDAAVHRKRD